MSQNLREAGSVEATPQPPAQANGSASETHETPPKPDPELITRERALLTAIAGLAAERGKAEKEIAKAHAARIEANDTESRQATEHIETRYQTEIAAADAAIQNARKSIPNRHQAETNRAQSEHDQTRKAINTKASSTLESAQKACNGVRWEAGTIYEATSKGAAKAYQERQGFLKKCDQRLTDLQSDTEVVLRHTRQYKRLKDLQAQPSANLFGEDPHKKYGETLDQAFEQLMKMNMLTIPRMFTGIGPVWLFPILASLMIYPAILLKDLRLGGGLAAGFALATGIPLWLWLWSIAKKKSKRAYEPLQQLLANAEALKPHCRETAKAEHERKQTECREKRDGEIARAEELVKKKTKELQTKREEDLTAAAEKLKQALAEAEAKRNRDAAAAEEKDRQTRAQTNQTHETDLAQTKSKYQTQKQANTLKHRDQWSAMATRWRDGLAAARSEIESIHAESTKLFVAWPGVDWQHWIPPSTMPNVMRVGEFHVDTSLIPDIVPKDEGLKDETLAAFKLPALIPFPERTSVLVKAEDQGKAAAGKLLQALMLRLLTAVPPGKVRFTILDPVTLGENFASFMHLTDIDEGLVTQRIWTEPSQIDERLIDLTEHMETVIQKYLRNEFQTLEEYNDMAGEVAEPYRFLVVANFPAHFSDASIRRLLSIASNGPRCGVQVLVSMDTKLPLPHGFQIKEFEKHAVTLTWKSPAFYWRERALELYPLSLDTPPPAEEFIDAVQVAGVKAKEAKKVEVPFEIIAPADDKWWAGDCKSELEVPLGRAGANKLQPLRLGRGTSQHVLIAGKTGSGKSTLLHALITNVALRYTPHEVELYLIDFKKGVEFKTYATHQLPHARVIAVESEREFGLSVLQRLDLELKARGDRFRDAGAQDLKGFRQAMPGVPTPRILLVVDEFQEFFIEDDKIAQDCSLLLDRLVRQGRAFGIHVLLGSQTLGGSYSLPKSTVGQMAVRIALQCSENDAHLILSEENSAARLLSRPGDAIYNDANGLVEGNHPFQVVWLSDERREIYLKQIHALALEKNMISSIPTIVFEGNLPADVSKNPLLNDLLARDDWPTGAKTFSTWLGDAIAIKDPTAAIFRRISGCNALIVGQNEEAALGIVTMMLIELAAQHPIDGVPADGSPPARFTMLDGLLPDSSNADYLKNLGNVVPHQFQYGGPRELPALLSEVYLELDRRQKQNDLDAATLYVFIFDLQRFRELRKQEEEFGYSRRGGEDKPPSPSKQIASILREGPSLGIHTIIWCDTLNNLNRTFDRQGMREFETRIMFQMSATDSSSLIDSPAASRLGVNRAFYHNEEQARLEKFRPYGLPGKEWLQTVAAKLARRATTQTPTAATKAATNDDNIAAHGSDTPHDSPQPTPVAGSE